MNVTRNTSIIAILLLTIFHEGILTPLHPLGEESQVDQRDDDENGSLTHEDFRKASSRDFINNEPTQDENRDPDAFEGDIQGDKDELRALLNNREVEGDPGKNGQKLMK